MGVLWEDEAWQEYLDWQEQDKKIITAITKKPNNQKENGHTPNKWK